MLITKMRLHVFAAAIFLQGCGLQTSPSSPLDFFENTRRRPADEIEKASIGNMPLNNCTGFFVKNDLGRNLFMTARHCFTKRFGTIERWCAVKGLVHAEDGARFECKEVLTSAKDSDLVLIELEGSTSYKAGLRLSSIVPNTGKRLKMLGYPQDENARGFGAFASENCWIHFANLQSPYQYPNSPHPSWMNDNTFSHNCSTFKGNSGGPILIEGTDLVIGMPYSFTDEKQKSWEATTFAASLQTFLNNHGSVLEELKVQVSNVQHTKAGGEYIQTGRYASETLSCDFILIGLYENSPQLQKIRVAFDCKPMLGQVQYLCDGSENPTCSSAVNNSDRSKFMNFSSNSFKYVANSGREHLFRLQ